MERVVGLEPTYASLEGSNLTNLAIPAHYLAPIQGIEPRSVGPEPTVLPLNEIGVVGMVRFERTASRSQGESSTSELHPDNYCLQWLGRQASNLQVP